MTTTIRHNVTIKAAPEKVYNAIITEEGIKNWFCKNTIAKPDLGSVNVLTFGESRNELEVTKLIPNETVEWHCLIAADEWIGTDISFDLEEKNGSTLVRFAHSGWNAVTDMFAGCNYTWALFMKSLKSYCETGTGAPS